MAQIDQIKALLQAGQRQQAFSELASFLKRNPDVKEAWWLMLALLDHLSQKIDCYRQILRIDPADGTARHHLEALLVAQVGVEPATPVEIPSHPERCPTCGGDLEIHFIGDLQDKWAICPYCDTKIDLPDSFRRTIHLREQHERPGLKHTVETTLIEQRADAGQQFDEMPAEVRSLLDQAHGDDLPDADELKALLKQGPLAIHRIDEHRLKPKKDWDIWSVLAGLNDPFNPPRGFQDMEEFASSLGENAIVIPTSSGEYHVLEGIPANQRTHCAKCDALVSKLSEKCQWCDHPLG